MSDLYHQDIYKFDEPVKSYWEATSNTNNKYNKDMVDWNYTAPREAVNLLKKYK